MIQNMIDGYLAKHPQKKRSAEEIKDLDPKSDINKLMVRILSFGVVVVVKKLTFAMTSRNL